MLSCFEEAIQRPVYTAYGNTPLDATLRGEGEIGQIVCQHAADDLLRPTGVGPWDVEDVDLYVRVLLDKQLDRGLPGCCWIDGPDGYRLGCSLRSALLVATGKGCAAHQREGSGKRENLSRHSSLLF